MRAARLALPLAAALMLGGGSAAPQRWWDSAAGGLGTPVYGRTLWVQAPEPPVVLPESLLGYWPPTNSLADQISGDAGSIGGASLAAESAVASGLAILTDGSGGATLSSTTMDGWRTDDDLTICAWVRWPATPTAFGVVLDTMGAGGTPGPAGWRLSTSGPGYRDDVRLYVSDGAKVQSDDISTAAVAPSWSTAGAHYCVSYAAGTTQTCYYAGGVLSGCATGPAGALGSAANTTDIYVGTRLDGGGTVPSGVKVACIEVHDTVLDTAGVAAALARCTP